MIKLLSNEKLLVGWRFIKQLSAVDIIVENILTVSPFRSVSRMETIWLSQTIKMVVLIKLSLSYQKGDRLSADR